MNRAYFFVAVTVLLTVAAQLVIKWQVGRAGEFPSGTRARLAYLADLLLNPWIIGCLAAGFVAALAWFVALSGLELSRAYPFVAVSFALVLVLSSIVFDERLTALKVVGASLIVAGIIVGSQG
jgi:multidrug transporter EmrE-like cation transporter